MISTLYVTGYGRVRLIQPLRIDFETLILLESPRGMVLWRFIMAGDSSTGFYSSEFAHLRARLAMPRCRPRRVFIGFALARSKCRKSTSLAPRVYSCCSCMHPTCSYTMRGASSVSCCFQSLSQAPSFRGVCIWLGYL